MTIEWEIIKQKLLTRTELNLNIESQILHWEICFTIAFFQNFQKFKNKQGL